MKRSYRVGNAESPNYLPEGMVNSLKEIDKVTEESIRKGVLRGYIADGNLILSAKRSISGLIEEMQEMGLDAPNVIEVLTKKKALEMALDGRRMAMYLNN